MRIEKNGIVFEGVKEVDGKIVCELCGEARAKLKMHMDGAKTFTNIYECACGNSISKIEQRMEDEMFWD